MTARLTELVQESLDRLTDGATVPVGLAARVRHRARRRAAIQFAAAGTVVVTGAAVLVSALAAGSTPRAGKPASVGLTAYVIRHASVALTAASRSTVAEASLTSTAGGLRVISWSGPRTDRTEIIAAGKPVSAGGYVVRHGGYEFVTIDYRNQTWQEQQIPPAAAGQAKPAVPAGDIGLSNGYALQLLRASPGCQPRPAIDPLTMTWTGYLHDLMACHALRVAGNGRVDGAAAVKLATARHPGHSPVSAVLWVSRASYLPLRLVLRSGPDVRGYQVDLRWLPATAANLAKTHILPPPAGFTRLG